MRLVKEGRFHWRIFTRLFTLEFHFFSNTCRLGLSVEEHYVFSIGLPYIITLFLSFGNGKYKNKELSISIFDYGIWWDFWTDSMGWSNKTSRLRKGCWHILDTFLGKKKYLREIIEERDVDIPMPEGCYKSHIKLCKDTWKRPLWFAETIKRIDADIPSGIPHQGKGENSYDCGEDGCYGMCCQAKSIADGVGKIVGDVLHDRVRYGGWNDWNYKRREVSGLEVK